LVVVVGWWGWGGGGGVVGVGLGLGWVGWGGCLGLAALFCLSSKGDSAALTPEPTPHPTPTTNAKQPTTNTNQPSNQHQPTPQNRFRELGCVCTPVKGPDYKEGKSYAASLLQQPTRGAAAPKTLGECLPKPKGPPKARGR